MVQSAQFYFLSFWFLFEFQTTLLTNTFPRWCSLLLGREIRIAARFFLGATPANCDDLYYFSDSHGNPALTLHLQFYVFPNARTEFHHRHQAPFDRGRLSHSDFFHRCKPSKVRFPLYPSKHLQGDRVVWFVVPFGGRVSVVSSQEETIDPVSTTRVHPPQDSSPGICCHQTTKDCQGGFRFSVYPFSSTPTRLIVYLRSIGPRYCRQAPFDPGHRAQTIPFDRGKSPSRVFLFYSSQGDRVGWFVPFGGLVSVVLKTIDPVTTTRVHPPPAPLLGTGPPSICPRTTLVLRLIVCPFDRAIKTPNAPNPRPNWLIACPVKAVHHTQSPPIPLFLRSRRNRPQICTDLTHWVCLVGAFKEHKLERWWFVPLRIRTPIKLPAPRLSVNTLPCPTDTPTHECLQGLISQQVSSALVPMGPKKTPHQRSPKRNEKPGRGSPSQQRRGSSSSPNKHQPSTSRRGPNRKEPAVPAPHATPNDALIDEAEVLEPPSLTNTASSLPRPPDSLLIDTDATMEDNPVPSDATTTAHQTVPGEAPAASPLLVFGSHKKTKGKSVGFSPGTSYGGSTSPLRGSRQRSYLYVTVKLSIEERSLILLIARLNLVLQGFKNLSIDFQVCGFDPDAQLSPISEVTSIGPKLTQLQRYFHGLYLSKTSWSQWHVSWVPPQDGYSASEFLTDANAVLSEFNSSMYAKWLQRPFTATAGWIFKTLEHTDLITLKLFLEQELRSSYDFTGEFALYRKVPFLGAASPPTPPSNVRASGRAIHVDTVDSLSNSLWEKLNRLLKSPAMRKFSNFEWKFIPQFHSRRSPEDQLHLRTSAAKQKLVHNAIATSTCSFFLDVDQPVDDSGTTIRRYLLDQRVGDTGPPVVLSIDRLDNAVDYIFTSAKEHADPLALLVQFSPLLLCRRFEPAVVRRRLSPTGLTALEDQYWDETQQRPRSRFTDSLRDDHMDDRDIRIIFDTLPDETTGGLKRPIDTAGLDIDDISQSSFNTQQGPTRSKLARFGSPQSQAAGPTAQVSRLEAERLAQDEKIRKLESQLAQLMAHISTAVDPPSISPTQPSTEDHRPRHYRLSPQDHFGDPWPRQKKSSVFRLAYANINGFDTEVYNNSSVTSLRQWLYEINPDIFLGCEPQINWKKMPWDGKLRNWFRTGEQQRITFGYNIHEAHLHNRRQYGGTFIIVSGPSADRVVATGVDPSGLGRWCWARFTASNNRSITAYIVYRPVRQSRNHSLSTYMQQSRYLESISDYMCPRRALLRDLQKDINQRIVLGDSLIIAGDFNDDISRGPIHDLFHTQLGFTEATIHRHPHQVPPATMSRGQLPVDAVWLSPDLPVMAASWLSFPDSPGDHRASVVDFNIDEILGEPARKVFNPQGRRLNSKLPNVQQHYTRLLEAHFHQHRLLPKLYSLYTQSWHHRWHEFALAVENLDRIRSEGMKFAEKRCRRFHSGATFFSPELDKWFKLRRLYSMVLQYASGQRKVRRATIIRLAKKCDIDGIFLIPIREIRRKFHEADLQYRALKPRSAELRENFLRQRLTESTYGSALHQAITTLIIHEQQRTTARHLRALEGNPLRRSVTAVQVESSSGELQHFSDQRDVEAALQRCFEDRFRLTDDSPLMKSPLFELLGNGSSTPSSLAILTGDTSNLPPSTSLYTRWLLEGMAKPTQAPPSVDIHISRRDFQRYWHRAKEKTASSISGLHFGHYKAAAFNDKLSEIHSLFTEIIFRTGYPLKRWQSGLQIILEKKPGVILVTKLRAILLMEADFNFGNKLLVGSRMIQGAISNKCLPSELYGGVKGRRVEYMSLGRRLFADILRQKRCTGAVASVDAQACYDRITHSTASMSCQRWGVPPRPLSAMLHTIQGMRFFLRTGYGDSDHFYGGGTSYFQGICQGNGAGPAVWLAISSVLVGILKAKTPCNPIRGALSAAGLLLLAMIFVDDTDLLLFDPPHSQRPSNILQRLQALIHLWQGLLHASGGSLGADKCSWCLVDFKWQAGKWSYHSSTTSPGDMFVKDSSGHRHKIKRIEPSQSLTVVGVEQSMDGSMDGQLRVLADSVTRWSRALASHSIPRHIAWAAIRSKIWPSLRFPLSATTISQQQGRKLMGPLYRSLLPRLGSNRNIPASVRYGPLEVAGLDLPEPYIYQGSQQVALFYHLYDTPTNEGHLLRVSLEHLQLEVGMSSPVFNLDFTQYGFLATPSWLTSLWRFVSTYSIHIDIPDFPLPPLCRTGDRFIMEGILQCPALSREEQVSANRCRLYLQTVVWSDLASGGGTSIRDCFFQVHRDPFVVSCYEWPVERPSKRDVANWQRCLTAVLGSHPLALGPWVATPHCTWAWWYDHVADLLFHHLHGNWLEYGASETRSTRFTTSGGPRYKLQRVHAWDERPSHLVRTTVLEYADGRVSLDGTPPAARRIPDHGAPGAQRPTGTIRQAASTWPEPFQRFLESSVFDTQGFHIAQAIKHGTAQGACDGSYMPTRSQCIGTCAWILEDSSLPSLHLCQGTALTSGWLPTDVNAYRSELQGIYTVLLALRVVTQLHNIESGSVRIACDNETAVELATHMNRALSTASSAHIDLLRSIHWLKQSLPIQITFVHVYGHQDRLTPLDCLPRLVQLNIRCDHMAKDAALRAIALNRLQLHREPLWGERVTCSLSNGIKLTGHIQSRVATWCAQQDTQRYLVEKEVIPVHLADKINWTGIGNYLRSQTIPYRLWASKHSFHFAATGRNMTRWGLSTVADCPCCGTPDESLFHLYECTDPRMMATRTAAINDFRVWMTSVTTHPDIITCFCSSLSLNSTMSAHASVAISAAATSQDSLGKWNTLVGRLSITWAALQDEYYQSVQCPKAILSWSNGMVEHLLTIGYKCWSTRNNILHDQTLGGLSLHEARQLNEDINQQFDSGTQHLRPCDLHLMTRRNRQQILSLPAAHKRVWLQSIILAREQGHLTMRATQNSSAEIMRRWLDSGRQHPL